MVVEEDGVEAKVGSKDNRKHELPHYSYLLDAALLLESPPLPFSVLTNALCDSETGEEGSDADEWGGKKWG